ncbi:MAG: trans-sulfuration enzyme family protein [Canibacter sp.]
MKPDKHDSTTVSDATWAVHGGNSIDPGTGAVRTPLVMANSYQLPEDPSNLNWSDNSGFVYTRNNAVNQVALEEKLAAFEGGEAAVTLASGVAALHAVFFTLLKTGDHVVVANVSYEAVVRLFAELLPERYGIDATFVDVSDHEAVRAAIRPNTKLIHVETIANPTTKVTDIRAIADIAHDAGAILTVDSTFTPPPFYRPLSDGADLVIHSLTKYINGHGDAMGGAVIGDAATIRRIRLDAVIDVGGVISPFNAWLIMRGSVTLPLRLEQHLASAERIAQFLAKDDRIAYVRYPGLSSHAEHELAERQFGGRGYGAVMSFALNGNSAIQNQFVQNLGIITSAVSLGHDETLIVHSGPEARGGSDRYPEEFLTFGHLRLSVGLEDPEDLIADLAAALDATDITT